MEHFLGFADSAILDFLRCDQNASMLHSAQYEADFEVGLPFHKILNYTLFGALKYKKQRWWCKSSACKNVSWDDSIANSH